MKTFIIVLLCSGCVVEPICKEGMVRTKRGFCVVKNDPAVGKEELEEFIDIVEKTFLEEVKYTREDLDKIYSENEVGISLIFDEIEYPIAGRDPCGVLWPKDTGYVLEMEMDNRILFYSALAHELLHLWLVPQGYIGPDEENMHPPEYFAVDGKGLSVEDKINRVLYNKYYVPLSVRYEKCYLMSEEERVNEEMCEIFDFSQGE